MRLKDVARRFDHTECRDAYTGTVLFNAQLLTFDEVRREALTFERRLLSVAPELTMPTRRALRIAGDTWIVGDHAIDQYLGEDIRHSYVAQSAPVSARILTLGQALSNATGQVCYVGRAWVKEEKFTQQSSHTATQFMLFCSASESVSEGMLIDWGSEYMIVRASHLSETGLRQVQVESLGPQALVSAQVSTGSIDPITEVITGSTITTNVLRIRWQALFAYGHPGAPQFGPEDIQLAVSSSAVTAPVGAKVVLSDSSRWQIKSALSYGGAWLCRAVRHV